jgi:putative aldouronate transport system permease protein
MNQPYGLNSNRSLAKPIRMKRMSRVINKIMKNRWLYYMILPGIIYFIIFKYLPMWGILIAFKDYKPFLGFFDSPWVGLKHFDRLFSEPDFIMLFRNTLLLAFYNLAFFFPIPIMMALLLNEMKNMFCRRFIQTLIYVPHFISWVVVVGLAYVLFTTEGGIVNDLIVSMGGQKINFLLSADLFRPMIITEIIWKETGWGTIIFLAAITGVDPQLYEAAKMDGASRWHQLWHITLPSIRSTIVILFILRLGTFLDTGFEQIYNMLNMGNRQVGEVFDTFVYTVGITQGQFSYSTAIGLFKSVIGLGLIFCCNKLAKKFGEEGVY